MNKKRFLMNGALLTAVGIAMRTVSLFFNAYVTHAVGAEGVGLYTVVMTVYNFGVTFATAGIGLTVTRLVANAMGEGRLENVPRILKGAVLYALIFSAAATAALLLGAELFASRVLSDVRAAAALKILATSFIPLAMIAVFSGYFVGIRRVAFNATTQILGQILKIAVTVRLLSRSFGLGAEAAARALALGTTVSEALCFLLVLLEFLVARQGRVRSAGINVGEVVATAAPLAASAYVRQALLTVEHILIPRCLRARGDSNSDALSSYGILHGMALPLIIYPMATLSSFSGLLVPELAEGNAAGDGKAMQRIATRSIEVTLTYGTVTAVMLFIFSEELGYVVYSSADAGYYVAVLASVVPIMYLDHVTDSILKGIGEQVYSMWVNVTDSLLSILLVVILIPSMGIMGYAVCIVIMEAYNFLLSFARLRRRIKIRPNVLRSACIPTVAALIGAYVTKRLFLPLGSSVSAAPFVASAVFALSATFLVYKAISAVIRYVLGTKMRIV